MIKNIKKPTVSIVQKIKINFISFFRFEPQKALRSGATKSISSSKPTKHPKTCKYLIIIISQENQTRHLQTHKLWEGSLFVQASNILCTANPVNTVMGMVLLPTLHRQSNCNGRTQYAPMFAIRRGVLRSPVFFTYIFPDALKANITKLRINSNVAPNRIGWIFLNSPLKILIIQ